jgi:hypothetical protein
VLPHVGCWAASFQPVLSDTAPFEIMESHLQPSEKATSCR